MNEFYEGCVSGCSHTLTDYKIVAATKTDKVIRDYFEEKYKAGEIHPTLWEETYKKLSNGVTSGYGRIAYQDDSIALINELKTNTAVLSAFKNHAQSHEMAALLVDSDGKRRSFSDFRKEAIKIDSKYNRQWLDAEFNYATRAARTSHQWQEFKRTEDLFPNLEYLPSQAGTPREAHTQYYGMIRPISDPIWQTIMPPNGWGCKCGIGKTRDNPTSGSVDPVEQIPGIPGNPGSERVIFTPSHPFVSAANTQQKLSVQSQLNALNQGRIDFGMVKVGKNNIRVHTKANPADLVANKDFSVAMVRKFKKDVEIREHSYVQGQKNPEFVYEKTIGDRYEMKGQSVRSSISNAFDKKLNKGGQLRDVKSVFIGIDFAGKLNRSNVTGAVAQLSSKLSRNKKVKFVIIKNGDKMIKIENKKQTFGELFTQIRKELVN